jgi:hypothetical protein
VGAVVIASGVITLVKALGLEIDDDSSHTASEGSESADNKAGKQVAIPPGARYVIVVQR